MIMSLVFALEKRNLDFPTLYSLYSYSILSKLKYNIATHGVALFAVYSACCTIAAAHITIYGKLSGKIIVLTI